MGVIFHMGLFSSIRGRKAPTGTGNAWGLENLRTGMLLRCLLPAAPALLGGGADCLDAGQSSVHLLPASH